MNTTNFIINNILKKSVRLVSKMKFDNKDSFNEHVTNFIDSIKSNLVKLRLRNSSFREDESKQPYQIWKVEFEVVFLLNDIYIDANLYESGSIQVFPSSRLYKDVNKLSKDKLGAFPEWNDSRTIATITGKARDY